VAKNSEAIPEVENLIKQLFHSRLLYLGDFNQLGARRIVAYLSPPSKARLWNRAVFK